jgi:hypothetical protein
MAYILSRDIMKDFEKELLNKVLNQDFTSFWNTDILAKRTSWGKSIKPEIIMQYQKEPIKMPLTVLPKGEQKIAV